MTQDYRIYYQKNMVVLDKIRIELLQPDTHFEEYTSTRIRHLVFAVLGVNGPTVRDDAIKLFERFIKWRSKKPKNYITKIGNYKLLTSSEYDKLSHFVYNTEPDYLSPEILIKKYFDFMDTIYNKYNACVVQ
jgi:hypothetical protein